MNLGGMCYEISGQMFRPTGSRLVQVGREFCPANQIQETSRINSVDPEPQINAQQNPSSFLAWYFLYFISHLQAEKA
jgi:hypothetical protein